MSGSFQDVVQALVEAHEAAEPFRQASPRHYLGRTPHIFEAFSSRGESAPPPPLCVQLEITNQCSTSCKMCFRYTWEAHTNREQLSATRIRELLTEFAAIGVQSIVLSGGEPVIHPEFAAILRHAHAVGLHVGILSNGIWPDDAVCDDIVRCADWIRLSVDGGSPETYDRVRMPMPGFEGGLPAVERSLSSLSLAKRKHRSACKLGISYTIQQANIENVPEMIAFAERCQALAQESGPVVVFKLAHGRGPFVCDVDQLKRFQETVLSKPSHLDNDRVDLRYMQVFMDRMKRENIAAGTPLKEYYKAADFSCFTPYLFSLVDAFGDVYVCCHHYDDNGKLNSSQRREYCVGSVVEQRFCDVWGSGEYQDMRRRLEHIDVEQMTACSQCTRHYAPNTVMTQLFKAVYSPIVDTYGKEAGQQLFERIVSPYSDEPACWF